MKKITFVIALWTLSASLQAQTQKKHIPTKIATHRTAPILQLKNYTDTLSYALGISMAKFYQHQGAKDINTTALSSAVKSVLKGNKTLLTEEQVNDILMNAEQKFAQEKSAAGKEAGKAFLLKNKTKPGIITLPDGIQYEILQKGDGPLPVDSNNVKVNYLGALLNGEEFDNSYKRNEPLDIDVTGVIKGWTEVLEKMPVGSKWRIWIPSDLAYGDRGAGNAIPPGSTLMFEIELLGINH